MPPDGLLSARRRTINHASSVPGRSVFRRDTTFIVSSVKPPGLGQTASSVAVYYLRAAQQIRPASRLCDDIVGRPRGPIYARTRVISYAVSNILFARWISTIEIVIEWLIGCFHIITRVCLHEIWHSRHVLCTCFCVIYRFHRYRITPEFWPPYDVILFIESIYGSLLCRV